jgi:hypothetical protein
MRLVFSLSLFANNLSVHVHMCLRIYIFWRILSSLTFMLELSVKFLSFIIFNDKTIFKKQRQKYQNFYNHSKENYFC